MARILTRDQARYMEGLLYALSEVWTGDNNVPEDIRTFIRKHKYDIARLAFEKILGYPSLPKPLSDQATHELLAAMRDVAKRRRYVFNQAARRTHMYAQGKLIVFKLSLTDE